MRFGLKIGFVERLQLVTSTNYSRVSDNHSMDHYNRAHNVIYLLYLLVAMQRLLTMQIKSALTRPNNPSSVVYWCICGFEALRKLQT
jgi:hypothetical protein